MRAPPPPREHDRDASAAAREEPQAQWQVHPPHAECLRNVLHQYLARAGGREFAAERSECAGAETARQAMDLDAGLARARPRQCGCPNVNAIAERIKSVCN